MNSYIMRHKISCSLLFLLGLFACTAANAWHGDGYHGGGGHYYHGGGYHGGYYRGGGYYHGGGGYYRGGGWGGAGIVVGVPLGGYYAPACTIEQECYPNGTCMERRVCD